MTLTSIVRRATRALTGGSAPTHGITDEAALEQFLAEGEVDGADFAYCPVHQRVTAHALHADGSQSCIDCRHTLNGAS